MNKFTIFLSVFALGLGACSNKEAGKEDTKSDSIIR